MIKILCFLRRKDGMTLAEFKAYYENNHAPLIKRLLPFYDSYKRNFAAEVQNYATGHINNKAAGARDFDVVTELTFSSQENYQKMIDALSDPVIGGEIARDEENIFDRDDIRVFLVEECE